jgi:hypothetical protein
VSKRQQHIIELTKWFGVRCGSIPDDEMLSAALKAFLKGKTVKLHVTPISDTQRSVDCWIEQ